MAGQAPRPYEHMKKIDKKMMIAEILKKRPELSDVLVEKYGLHCVGCPMGRMESLEDGAKSHGMSDKEIIKMMRDLG